MKVITTSLAIVCLLSTSTFAIQLSQRDADEDKALAAIQEAISAEAGDGTGEEGAVDATQAAIDAAEAGSAEEAPAKKSAPAKAAAEVEEPTNSVE
jgi:hypothetical protein